MTNRENDVFWQTMRMNLGFVSEEESTRICGFEGLWNCLGVGWSGSPWASLLLGIGVFGAKCNVFSIFKLPKHNCTPLMLVSEII